MSLPAHFSVLGSPVAAAHVRSLQFLHELGRPWRLRLEVESTDPNLDLDRIIGAEARLDLPNEPLMPAILGVVDHAAQTAREIADGMRRELQKEMAEEQERIRELERQNRHMQRGQPPQPEAPRGPGEAR